MAKIGEILIKRALITPAQLDEAFKESLKRHEFLGKTLIKLKMITEAQLLEVLAEQMNIPFYPSLKEIDIPRHVLNSVDVKTVTVNKVIPLAIKGNVMTVAVSDPVALWSIEELEMHSGYKIERILVTEDEIKAAINKYYGTVDLPSDKDNNTRKENVASHQSASLTQDNQEFFASDFIEMTISEALTMRATEIHWELYQKKIRMRYRVDGILYDKAIIQGFEHNYPAVLAQLKRTAKININDNEFLKYGQMRLEIKGKPVEIGVAVIPCLHGENITLTITTLNNLLKGEELGFFPEDLLKLEEIINNKGLVLFVGPKSSGKTTTMYSYLNKINRENIKIITLERIPRYNLEAIVQVVFDNNGVNASQAFQACLNHNPDVIMVDGLLDKATLELALRVAASGRLILYSLPVNDILETLTYFNDSGIEPYLIAGGLQAIVSQYLLRMICPFCREEIKDKVVLPEMFRKYHAFRGKGCAACTNSGYRGQTIVYEILENSLAIKEFILQKTPVNIIYENYKKTAKTLRDVAICKIESGVFTVDEIVKTIKI